MSADGIQSGRQVTSRRRYRRCRELLLAAGLALLGTALALVCGAKWTANRQQASHQAFDTAAQALTTEVGTLLDRDEDALRTMRAVMMMRPDLSGSRFAAWYGRLTEARHEVGGLGIGVVRRVAPGELLAFERARSADPAFRALPGPSPSHPAAAGPGPFCFVSAVVATQRLSPFVGALLQANWCDPSSWLGRGEGALLDAATDTGHVVIARVALPVVNTTMFEAAIYRRDMPLGTVAQRRAAVTGWVVESFDLPALVRTALAGRRDLALTLRYRAPGLLSTVYSAGGTAAPGAFTERAALTLTPGWTVTVADAGSHRGPSAGLQGIAIAVGGSVLSLLLALLFFQSARSRERALAMVAEKTGELRRLALHDPLTGLPNRVLVLDRAEQMLARARREQVAVSALYIDIDGFKQINDSFGHQIGDRFLQMVGDRLRGVVRDSETAGRLAGDEFVVLLESGALEDSPERVAERVLEVLREPYDLCADIGRQIVVNASIGIATGTGETAEQLLADADVALYTAKDAGRNRYAAFEPAMHTASRERVALELDLREALERDELHLVYQPTLDLGTGNPRGAEALLRWNHPERGAVAPDEFIPVAERSGLIIPIGRWVLRTACAQAAGWAADGTALGISVNVSARQLDSDEFVVDVRDVLADTGLTPGSLTLEITETALMRDAEASARRLETLKEMGVRIAIDDFGTGYCSLGYLRRFRVDTLKIDRSFVQCIGDRDESRPLVHTLIQLGKTLGLEVVGEGIECTAQLEELRREQCDVGQGFLFARPMPADELAAFISTHESAAVTPARS